MSRSKFPIRRPPSQEPGVTVSAFAAAAENKRFNKSAEIEPGSPWFRDPQKLLAAVVKHAVSSPTFARDFVTAAGTLA